MKIINFYPSGNIYQVVNEDESTIYFQGNYFQCLKFISNKEENYNEKFKSEL
jgi:hypothetical protein